MTTEVFITSDWHLDARTAGAPRRSDLVLAVDEVVGKCIARSRQVPVGFVFAGDLADPHKASSCHASAVAAAAAARLSAAGVWNLWLPGNHDVVQDGTGDHTLLPVAALESAFDEVEVHDRPGFFDWSRGRLLCLPYPSTATQYDPEEWVRSVDDLGCPPLMAVGHLSLPDMHPGSETNEMPRGRDLMWPVAAIRERWGDIPVVAAHYHRGQVTPAGVRVIGSLGRLTFSDEEHEPGYLVVEV